MKIIKKYEISTYCLSAAAFGAILIDATNLVVFPIFLMSVGITLGMLTGLLAYMES